MLDVFYVRNVFYVFYVRNVSFPLDAKVFAKTFSAVFKQESVFVQEKRS